jgi:hypothetical protein
MVPSGCDWQTARVSVRVVAVMIERDNGWRGSNTGKGARKLPLGSSDPTHSEIIQELSQSIRREKRCEAIQHSLRVLAVLET